MTTEERAELEAAQSFVDLLGISEMTDSEFDRYLALLDLKKADGGDAS